jgi:hypothetical protein
MKKKNQNIQTRMNNFSFLKPICSGNTGFLAHLAKGNVSFCHTFPFELLHIPIG